MSFLSLFKSKKPEYEHKLLAEAYGLLTRSQTWYMDHEIVAFIRKVEESGAIPSSNRVSTPLKVYKTETYTCIEFIRGNPNSKLRRSLRRAGFLQDTDYPRRWLAAYDVSISLLERKLANFNPL